MSEITKALIAFHKDVDKIDKNARGNYGKFADLANVLSTVTPALLRNDLVITQEFLGNSLITTLRHSSGEMISSSCDLAVAEGRNKTQEWGKAVTYQRRYAIVSLLGLVADMDMDGESLDPPAPPAEKSAPKKTVKKKAAPKVDDAAEALAKSTGGEVVKGDLADVPLSKEEKEMILANLKEVRDADGAKLKSIVEKFREFFPSAASIPMSEAITTQAHVAFINDLL